MATKVGWKQVRSGAYIMKHGDRVTYNGSIPEDVGDPEDVDRELDLGFVVHGYAGQRWEYICDNYEGMNARLWTKSLIKIQVPTRMALNERYSTPLPLP